MDSNITKRKSRPIATAAITLITIFGGLAVLLAIADSGVQLNGHGGPKTLVSLGRARFQSCDYQGSFVGGAGYDCIVKNVSTTEPRAVGNLACGGFDRGDRLIGSVQQALDLYGAVMAPQQERIVRIYLPEKSASAVCSDTGDILTPGQLRNASTDLARQNLLGEVPL
jgi:hypothetical protein